MVDTNATPVNGSQGTSEAKSHFAKAVEEAKAGVQALGKEAQGRAGEYREKLHDARDEWTDKGREKGSEAKDMAYQYARQGKTKASEAISGLGQLVEKSAASIDETIGVQYGNYARSAASSIKDTATKLDSKSLEELGEDARTFVREKPAMAVGLAAAAGYMLARLFRR